MKIKITILFTTIFIISGSVFGQSPDVKAETKTTETKSVTVAKLPSSREILDKYVQAIGGRDANEKIQSRLMKGNAEIAPMGIKGTTEIFSAAPDKLYSKTILNGIGEIIEAYDGKDAWSMNPLQGNRDKTGTELMQTKLMATFHRETSFEKLYPKMEVKGIEKVGEREAYVLVATPAGLDAQTFYFDKQSGLLLREDSTLTTPEGAIPVKTFYDDYREVDGVKMPFKIRAVLPQFESIVTVTEIKNGVKIDDALFSKPKQ